MATAAPRGSTAVRAREEPGSSGTSPIIFLVSSEAPCSTRSRPISAGASGTTPASSPPTGPAAGLAQLAALADAREPVALLIADQRMPEMTGIEFLARAHALHPLAKRILLVERDYTTANPIVPAMMLGQIDYHLVKPWSPTSACIPAVSEFLASWARSGRRRSRCSGSRRPENSARAHEIRDLLTRFNTPFAFHAADSEEGAALLREVGQAGSGFPTVVRHDGRVLVDPTDGELVEAVGGGTRLGVGRLRRRDRRRRARRPLGGGLCGLGGARHDRAGAADLRRPGRARARASATSPASPGGSAATTSRIARASRRGCSGRTWSSRRRRRRCAPRVTSAIVQVADGQRGRRAHRRARHAASRGGVSGSRGWRS